MTARAKLFWTGRSQAVRLPKEFRFTGDEVLIHRQGTTVVLEPSGEWPAGYFESLGKLTADFRRPRQGRQRARAKLK